MKKTILLFGMLVLSFFGFGQTAEPPVNNLGVSLLDNDTVLLTWDFPSGDISEITLSWSNMVVSNQWGSQAGQCATDQCQLFDRMDLRNLIGWGIKDISAILSPYDKLFPLGNYAFRIWKDDGEEMIIVFEHPIVNPTFNEVITYVMDSNIMIEPDVELRIGYYMDWYADYPWVVDDLPTVDEDKGGRIRYYRDWNPTSECKPIEWEKLRTGNLCISSTLSCPNGSEGIAQGVTGYRIYRGGTLIKEIPYSFVNYFTDTEFARENDVVYCVTAVYGEEESEPVCVTTNITGIGESLKKEGFSLSPNPTTGLIHIEGASVSEVQVYNRLGQMVKTVRGTNEIDLSGLVEGVYLLRIFDQEGNSYLEKIVKE